MTIIDIMDDSTECMWGDRVVTRADQIEIAPMLTGDQLEKFREIGRANTAGMDPFTASVIGGFPRVPDLNTQDNYKRQMMARCAREMRESPTWAPDYDAAVRLYSWHAPREVAGEIEHEERRAA